jgi:opacity protein-like surface antigen
MGKLLGFLILVVSSAALAQQPPPAYPNTRRPVPRQAARTAPRPAPRQVRYTPYQQTRKAETTMDGFSAVVGYWLGSSFDASAQNQTGTYNSGSSFSLGVKYGSIPADGFGWMADVYYEFSRTLNSVTQNGTTVNFSPAPSLGQVMIEANLAWAFGLSVGNIYPFAGLNYNVPMASNFASNFNISGSLGYQLGVGYHFMHNWGVELLYRFVNFSATSTASFDYFRLNGFGLRALYTF